MSITMELLVSFTSLYSKYRARQIHANADILASIFLFTRKKFRCSATFDRKVESAQKLVSMCGGLVEIFCIKGFGFLQKMSELDGKNVLLVKFDKVPIFRFQNP